MDIPLIQLKHELGSGIAFIHKLKDLLHSGSSYISSAITSKFSGIGAPALSIAPKSIKSAHAIFIVEFSLQLVAKMVFDVKIGIAKYILFGREFIFVTKEEKENRTFIKYSQRKRGRDMIFVC